MTELEMEMTRKMRSRTEKLGHDGDFWSDDDKDRLKFLFNTGYGITEIALRLERSEPAVYQQIQKMSLYERQRSAYRRKNTPRGGCSCPNCGTPMVCGHCE